MTDRAVAKDLEQLLHPRDPLDVPTPAFPSGNALVAWAHAQPRGEVIDALTDTLEYDGLPQQSMAAAVLRDLGIDVDGIRGGGDFVWRLVDANGVERSITPSVLPPLPVAPLLPEAAEDRGRWLSAEIKTAFTRILDNRWETFVAEGRSMIRDPELA